MNGSCRRGTLLGSHFRIYGWGNGKASTFSRRCVDCGYTHESVDGTDHLPPQDMALSFASSEPDYQDEEVHLGVESFQWLTAR